MTDIKQRLEELDELEAPDMRASIEVRAARLRSRPSRAGLALRPGVSPSRGAMIAAGTATAILLLALVAVLVARDEPNELAGAPILQTPTTAAPVVGAVAGQSVSVTVSGVTDHHGHELAGVLYAGSELLDLDADALGGFWAVIDGDEFTATEVVRTPAADPIGRFPFVTDTALTVEPGTYTLVVWVDHGLGGFERWVPVNTDSRGLYGCHYTFDTGTDTPTAITIPANLHPDGWNVDCLTGEATPNTNAAAAVAAPADPWEDLPTAMDPVTGLGAGRSLRVTVSGVTGRVGDHFAAVLYGGADLSNLSGEALGGFWAVISSNDQSLTQVVRAPGEFGVGRFPYVSNVALTVEPGTYTVVLWVDETLTPISRWVPINSYGPGDPLMEGTDLYGCHMVVDVGDASPADVAVPANLHHNGWNVDCETGVVIPGSDAAAAVSPWGADDFSAPRPNLYSTIPSCDESYLPVGDVALQPDGAQPIAVSEVTLHGGPFFEPGIHGRDIRSGCGFEVDPGTIADGLLFPRDQQWDEGPIWWDGSDGRERWIEITLDGAHLIDSAVVQTDNNDRYLLSYRQLETGAWVDMWNIPFGCCFGMQTHPNPSDAGQRRLLTEVVETDTLRFEAIAGDGMYAVSELQVFGEPLP